MSDLQQVAEKDGIQTFDKKQPLIGLALIVVIVIFGIYIKSFNAVLPIQLLAGASMGYVLSRARFGFAGGVKRIYVRGEGSLTKALLLMLVVTMFLFFGIQWFAAQQGAVPAFMASEGQSIIPGTQNVKFTNIGIILGGFLFGMGMILAGGCASGTLTDMGEGEGRALVALIFFVLGSAPGEWARYTIDQTAVGKVGFQMYLPEVFGFFGALLISLVAVGLIYWFTIYYENKRKAEGTYMDPEGDWEEFEKPLVESENSPFFSFQTYHKLFIERFTFKTGALLIAVIATFIVITTGKAWGVTSAFSAAAVALLRPLGIGFTSPAFTDIVGKVDAGLLTDGGTIRNIGLILGGTVAFLLAGRMSFKIKLSKKDLLIFAFGGLLMGFGARFAKGCNAGALYSAMSTFSVSGWVFLITMTLGGLAGLKLFAGKADTIPPLKNK